MVVKSTAMSCRKRKWSNHQYYTSSLTRFPQPRGGKPRTSVSRHGQKERCVTDTPTTFCKDCERERDRHATVTSTRSSANSRAIPVGNSGTNLTFAQKQRKDGAAPQKHDATHGDITRPEEVLAVVDGAKQNTPTCQILVFA